jgi:hypothetical protein
MEGLWKNGANGATLTGRLFLLLPNIKSRIKSLAVGYVRIAKKNFFV